MILAIKLCQTDLEENETVTGQIIYTLLIGSFLTEKNAEEFAEKKDNVMLIDTDTGKIIKDGIAEIKYVDLGVA